MRIAPLDRSSLAAARALLGRACAFDRADVVAEEKLFGNAPHVVEMKEIGTFVAQPFGAWIDDELVGVASAAGNRVRLVAVDPDMRRRGIGTALLDRCITAVTAPLVEPAKHRANAPLPMHGGPQQVPDQVVDPAMARSGSTARALDQPGNYLAPGIDERNVEAITWLERRGWTRGEPRTNVLLDVRDNPRVTTQRLAELTTAAIARGYEIRRARPDETALLDAVAIEFGGAWPFELARGLEHAGVHVALRDNAYCSFAAHDGNNAGLGWFGPTGTWPAHRGKGLGEVLLLACLVDVARDHAQCEVAWIGPRPFYEKVAGIAAERRFIPMLLAAK